MLAVGIIAGWLLIGAVTGFVMARRGHDMYSWFFLALVMGPLAIPLAVSASRHHPVDVLPDREKGEFDVLVALDGSPASAAALDVALPVIRPKATSVTLAAVLDFDATTSVRGHQAEQTARALLDDTARRVAESVRVPVDTVVLHGVAAQRLSEYAAESGYELIVAGNRGAIARRLAACSRVPVLIGPARA